MPPSADTPSPAARRLPAAAPDSADLYALARREAQRLRREAMDQALDQLAAWLRRRLRPRAAAWPRLIERAGVAPAGPLDAARGVRPLTR
ncbi:hypothetical protein [Piscinibacter sakaiensis]|uniref:Uncharacterized protein n=1 Tax=Piscinibacter sakaiensis TaxID=1547922 RepID=A0A0K8P0E9_PISS1|nr:hypothetical protein [Piscinibacter sakaiensis]GAP36127.1 hypothetical protein ISF6_1967 [Piscinibacter sakaiensis]